LDGVKQNLDNPYSLEIARNFLMRNMSRKQELRKLQTLLELQGPALRDNLFNPYKKIVNILTRNKIELAKFKFNTPEGKTEPLTLSKGKRYLIDMWFVGCAPCIEQHKEMTDMLATLKNNNVEVIGISVDQEQSQWKKFLEKKKYGWLNVREVDDTKLRLRTDMLIEIYPTYFLIDSEGTIVHRTNSFREMTAYLKL
jgi:peroxiredoxin